MTALQLAEYLTTDSLLDTFVRETVDTARLESEADLRDGELRKSVSLGGSDRHMIDYVAGRNADASDPSFKSVPIPVLGGVPERYGVYCSRFILRVQKASHAW